MCLPFSQNYGMIGGVRNTKYSPEKQKRFDAHQASQRQKLADSGFDFNSDKATNPAWGLINVVDEMKWNQKDNEKYGYGYSSASPAINNPSAITNTGNKKDYQLKDKPKVGTASGSKSNKEGKKYSTNKGGTGTLKIKKNPSLNNSNLQQGGLNL